MKWTFQKHRKAASIAGCWNSVRKRKAEPLCIKCWKNKIRTAERIHPNNIKKIIRALERLHEGEENVKPFQQVQQETTDYETILIGLTRDRAELYDRINRRVEVLIEQGLLEEVEELMRMGMTEDHISMKGHRLQGDPGVFPRQVFSGNSYRQCEKKHATLREKTVNVVPQI